MRVNDAITGAVLVIFAVAEIAYTRTFPSLHGQSYGPNLFPALIGVGLAVCGIILIVRGLLGIRTGRRVVKSAAGSVLNGEATKPNQYDPALNRKWIDLSGITDSKHARINALLVIVFLLLYIFLSDWIGFIPISIITIAVLLYRMGSSIVIACVIAFVATAVIQLLFARLLLVPLPAGLLQGLVW